MFLNLIVLPGSFLRNKEASGISKFGRGFCNGFNGCFEGDCFTNREDANEIKEVRQQIARNGCNR